MQKIVETYHSKRGRCPGRPQMQLPAVPCCRIPATRQRAASIRWPARSRRLQPCGAPPLCVPCCYTCRKRGQLAACRRPALARSRCPPHIKQAAVPPRHPLPPPLCSRSGRSATCAPTLFEVAQSGSISILLSADVPREGRSPLLTSQVVVVGDVVHAKRIKSQSYFAWKNHINNQGELILLHATCL